MDGLAGDFSAAAPKERGVFKRDYVRSTSQTSRAEGVHRIHSRHCALYVFHHSDQFTFFGAAAFARLSRPVSNIAVFPCSVHRVWFGGDTFYGRGEMVARWTLSGR